MEYAGSYKTLTYMSWILSFLSALTALLPLVYIFFMRFDEKMGKVNWRLVRIISNFGYQFMPREKGVRFQKI